MQTGVEGVSTKNLFLGIVCGLVAAVAVLSIAACTGQKTAPDPAQIEEEIAAAKVEELELVRSTIADPERKARLIGLLAERDRVMTAAAERVAAHKEQVARLDADYDAERADFEAVLADYNRSRADLQKELVDLIVAMKQTTTAEEWKSISAFQLKRLNLQQLAYGGPAGGS